MGRHFSDGSDDANAQPPSDGEAELEALRRLRTGEKGPSTGAGFAFKRPSFSFRRKPKNPEDYLPRERRSWPRRLLVVFNVSLAILLVLGVAGFGYVKWQFGRVDKIDLGDVLGNDNGDDDPGGAMTILMVGSDSRENLAAGESKSFGSAELVGGQRSDTMMLLHIDPKAKQAAILSLPRDLLVTIPGTGGKDRINSAFNGGEAKLINTIKQNFDISIDHYVEVDFNGFKGIVNSIGGVQVPFSAPVRDWGYDDVSKTNRNLSGLDIPNAGCINLSGDQALSYVRSRHYQVKEGGRWVSDPQSDITRIQRQQDFIRRVMKKAVEKGTSNPLTLNALISNGVKNVKIDDDFTLGDMTKIARRFQPLDPSSVEMMTMPNKASSSKPGALDVKQPDAKQTIERFLGKNQADSNAEANVPVETISVRVLNGSGVSGLASQTANELGEIGFVRGGVGDAKAAATTSVRYATGNKAKAQTLAKYLGGDVTLTEDSSIKGIDLIVTLGRGFSGVSDPSAPKPTTTTPPATAPQTTTTTESPFVPSADVSC
jgi:LCP family protein required for cell wall assembly